MRFHVIGAGAIGGLVGGHLARAGYDVTLVDANTDHVAAIRENGLRIEGAANFIIRVPAITPDELEGPLDVVLLAVKSQHSAAAIAPVAPLLAADGLVLSMQNGLEAGRIKEAVGGDRTFVSLITFGGNYAGPGTIHFSGRAEFMIGNEDGRLNPKLEELAEILTRCFQPCTTTDNVLGAHWTKSAIGGVYFASAVMDADVIDLVDDPRCRLLFQRIVEEEVDIADQLGIEFVPVDGFDPRAFRRTSPDEAGIEASWAGFRAYWSRNNSQARTGVWRDLAIHRRPTEVNGIVGAMIRIGADYGVPTPYLNRVYELVRVAEQEGLTPSTSGVEHVLAALEGVTAA